VIDKYLEPLVLREATVPRWVPHYSKWYKLVLSLPTTAVLYNVVPIVYLRYMFVRNFIKLSVCGASCVVSLTERKQGQKLSDGAENKTILSSLLYRGQ